MKHQRDTITRMTFILFDLKIMIAPKVEENCLKFFLTAVKWHLWQLISLKRCIVWIRSKRWSLINFFIVSLQPLNPYSFIRLKNCDFPLTVYFHTKHLRDKNKNEKQDKKKSKTLDQSILGCRCLPLCMENIKENISIEKKRKKKHLTCKRWMIALKGFYSSMRLTTQSQYCRLLNTNNVFYFTFIV